MDTRKKTLLGIAFAVTGFFLFSTGDVIAKLLQQMDYGAFQVSFYYSLTACITLLIFSGKLGGLKATLQTKHKRLHFFRSLLQAPSQALIFYAFAHMPLANVYAIIFLSPFITTMLAIPVLREKASLANWLLIFSGFTGVLIAMRPGVYGLSLPVLAVLLVVFSASFRFLSVRIMGTQETPLSLALYPAFAIVLATLVPALTAETELTFYAGAMLLAGGAVFGSGLVLTYLAFRYAPAGIAAPFHFSQIVWGVIAGILVFNDPPDFWTLFGCAVIILSGIGLGRLKAKEPKVSGI